MQQFGEPTREIPSRIRAAGVIIQNPEGKILLIHRDAPAKGNVPPRAQWETIGGGVADHIKDETPQEAVIREAWEEAGIEIEVGDQAGSFDFSEDGNNFRYISFNATIVSGEPKPLEPKHDKVGWFSWEELREMTEGLSANLKNLVAAKFAGQLNLTQGDSA
jgi:ADP-ribose pyrophosphatase YjhB (NUDIX family)